MAGVPHDVLLLALKENPGLLAELLRRVAGVTLDGPLVVGDSAVKFAVSLERYPDLLFTTPVPGARPGAGRSGGAAAPGEPSPSWIIVEVQNRKDERKSKSWHLATSVLLQTNGMGDVVVITASRSVARWAMQVAQHRGALGTAKGLTPVVLHLSRGETARLLDPAVPQLALFAVWARGRGAGSVAKEVVRRALEVTAALPGELQEAQTRAILAMLSERLLGFLKEMSMDVNQIKETKASRAFRMFFENRGREEGLAAGEARGLAEGEARGLAEGKRSGLLSVLVARGLTPDEGERKQIASLKNLEVLDLCIQTAVTAATVAEALAPARKRAPARARASNGHTKPNGRHR